MSDRTRETVDLAAYPDLVVIELGMRVTEARGLRTLMWVGPAVRKSVQAGPDGLLIHKLVVYSLAPTHVGFRQYWRDFEALDRWTHDQPHRSWWKQLLSDSGGTTFWHETYFRRGGMEAIYLNMAQNPFGLGEFAPRQAARKSMFSARQRLGLKGGQDAAPAIAVDQLYK